MDDYLAVGTCIANRLSEQMPESSVKQLEDVALLDQVSIQGHLIMVAYAGEIVAKGASIQESLITQRWLTIVTVPNAGKVLQGDYTKAKAGPLLWQIVKALQGKRFDGFTPLVRANPPQPRLVGQYSHFPLAWEVSFLCRAAVDG